MNFIWKWNWQKYNYWLLISTYSNYRSQEKLVHLWYNADFSLNWFSQGQKSKVMKYYKEFGISPTKPWHKKRLFSLFWDMHVYHKNSFCFTRNNIILLVVIMVREVIKWYFKKLFTERILEDHDTLVENMVMWTRDTKNRILYEEREEKNDLFRRPEVPHFGGPISI